MGNRDLVAREPRAVPPADAQIDGSLPPRLIHVTTVAASLWGLLSGQIAFMKSRGLDVRGIASPGPLLDEAAQREGMPVCAINMARRIEPLNDLISLWRLWRQLRRWRPAIVHSHTPKGGLLGMLAAAAARSPLRIYHLRGLPLETAVGWRRHLFRFTEWLACRAAHQVFCISESLRQEALRANLCPPDKIKVLHRGSGNGVDARHRFNPARFDRDLVRRQLEIPSGVPVLGFVGRMARDKGIVDLTQSWEMLAAHRPDLHWIIIGDVDSRDPIPPKIHDRLRSDPRVHVLGFVRDVAPWYAAMDVCVLPTYREGFGNVLLEAAAMKLPVVATRVTGCIDAVIDGQTGILVAPRDAQSLAMAIARYLDDPKLRQRHGQAGRRRVLEDFRPGDIWSALYDEYRTLLRHRGILIAESAGVREVEQAA